MPVYSFAETHYLANAYVTQAYKNTLFDLTGKVNISSFRSLPTGSVLFLGASGATRGQDDYEISFRFAASPNQVGLVVGSITGIAKKGWEYMWVRYEDAVDSGAQVKQPVAVYIEQVYRYADFRLLGIGS